MRCWICSRVSWSQEPMLQLEFVRYPTCWTSLSRTCSTNQGKVCWLGVWEFEASSIENISSWKLIPRILQWHVPRRVAHLQSYESDSDTDNGLDIGIAEWTKNKKIVSCPWIKNNLDKYSFDINKADMIFDIQLREKQIQLSPNHTISLAEELKKKKYGKWHNSNSHYNNECKVFRQQIQSAIEQGRIKFEDNKKSMKFTGTLSPLTWWRLTTSWSPESSHWL